MYTGTKRFIDEVERWLPGIELVAVVNSPGDCMQIQCPILFRKHSLGVRMLAVGLAEACLVSMRGVARDGSCGNSSIVFWVSGVCQAILTTDRAPLGKNNMKLTGSVKIKPGSTTGRAAHHHLLRGRWCRIQKHTVDRGPQDSYGLGFPVHSLTKGGI